MYEIPEPYYYRLHHPRPRFKSDIESVLLFMASEICGLGEHKPKEMRSALNRAIQLFPGNLSAHEKTINNWRTEITSLLGLIEYTDHGTLKPSALAHALNDNQDLIQFFRYFCYKFQYPGGHLKPHETAAMIRHGIKFKPAKYILLLLEEGCKLAESSFGVSKEEITHCVFNDLRVTKDGRSPKESAALILKNRSLGLHYQRGGDIVRYAGDILDYMQLANLVAYRPNGKYYLRTHEYEAIESIKSSNDYFSGYDDLYHLEYATASEVKETQSQWFAYVNQGVDPSLFQADIYSLLVDPDKESCSSSYDDPETLHKREVAKAVAELIAEAKKESHSLTTKKIGDLGEAISIQHEKKRLIQQGLANLAQKVVKIPETYSIGYDIKSYEGLGELQRLIEVKTTISKNKLHTCRFQMTPNEWGAAETNGSAYFIYRLMIYDGSINLFVIRDPVATYKANKLKMSPRNGAEITYTDASGFYEKVLL